MLLSVVSVIMLVVSVYRAPTKIDMATEQFLIALFLGFGIYIFTISIIFPQTASGLLRVRKCLWEIIKLLLTARNNDITYKY